MDRADLEAQLRAHWRRQDLAIYADLLQTEGDPRGELIATYLALGDGDKVALKARQDELLEALAVPREHWQLCRSGFLRTVTSDNLDVLDTAMGPFVRRIELRGSFGLLGYHLARVAKQPRPWLTELKLAVTSTDGDELQLMFVMAGTIERLPHLAHVTVTGSWINGIDDAKQLATLAMDYSAFAIFSGRKVPCPTVRELVFVRGPEAPDVGIARPDHVEHNLPALRRLDCSALVAMLPHTGILAWLARTNVVTQLEELVVPAPRAQPDVEALAHLRVRFTGTLAVARAYTELAWQVDGVDVPVRRPWPSREHVRSTSVRLRVIVALDNMRHTVLATSYAALIDELERLTDRDDTVAAAWTPVFAAIGSPAQSCTLGLPNVVAAAETLAASNDPILRGMCLGVREVSAERVADAYVRFELDR